MNAENIEIVAEVPAAKSLSQSKVKNFKRAMSVTGKMCVYFKDMECRIPMCDMKACEKCTEGSTYCTRVTFIKNLVKKILIFFACLLIFTEI